MTKSAFLSQRLFQESVGLAPGALLVEGEQVRGIVGLDAVPSDFTPVDLGSDAVTPAMVDTHVHVNEPGRTEWEGFYTATQAAAAGGIATVGDMPLNCLPVTTTKDAVSEKLSQLSGKLHVDCCFHGGIVPGNADQIPLMLDAGVRSFKCFLIDSGIDEFPAVTQADLDLAMPRIAEAGATLLVHAELECEAPDFNAADLKSYGNFLASRPKSWENAAVAMVIGLAKKHRCRVHIVHLSSAEALVAVAKAKDEGVPITVETCPHYLNLCAEDIPDGDARFKCCPPIRERENQDQLWQALKEGVIDFVVSDHSPCTPALKNLQSQDLASAWGGISSLQFGLPLMWTACVAKGVSLSSMLQWMCEKPTYLISQEKRKGRLAAGFDADFVVWDPEATFEVKKDMILHRHKECPYEGRRLQGVVRATFLRGQQIYSGGSDRMEIHGRVLG